MLIMVFTAIASLLNTLYKRLRALLLIQWRATEKFEPPAGLEPAIPGLGGRCLIHWATEAIANIRVVLVKSLVRLRF